MNQKLHVGHEIRTVSNLIKRKITNSPVLAHTDRLTGMHGWIIGYLNEKSEKGEVVFQRDLETELSIRRSTVTGIIQLMEKNGLITRESVEYDARLKKLILTPLAKTLHMQIKEEINTIEASLTKGLSEQELQELLRLLEKIKSNLE